ncbi:MAG: hypothetical protein ACYS8Y_13695 [Planctomycetota bacterium]
MTGGDEGEGETNITITPTLALPRQGGGRFSAQQLRDPAQYRAKDRPYHDANGGHAKDTHHSSYDYRGPHKNGALKGLAKQMRKDCYCSKTSEVEPGRKPDRQKRNRPYRRSDVPSHSKRWSHPTTSLFKSSVCLFGI